MTVEPDLRATGPISATTASTRAWASDRTSAPAESTT